VYCPFHAENKSYFLPLYSFNSPASLPFWFGYCMCACMGLANSSHFSVIYLYPTITVIRILQLVNIYCMLCLFMPYILNDLHIVGSLVNLIIVARIICDDVTGQPDTLLMQRSLTPESSEVNVAMFIHKVSNSAEHTRIGTPCIHFLICLL
jgi:hypothetical protein